MTRKSKILTSRRIAQRISDFIRHIFKSLERGSEDGITWADGGETIYLTEDALCMLAQKYLVGTHMPVHTTLAMCEFTKMENDNIGLYRHPAIDPSTKFEKSKWKPSMTWLNSIVNNCMPLTEIDEEFDIKQTYHTLVNKYNDIQDELEKQEKLIAHLTNTLIELSTPGNKTITPPKPNTKYNIGKNKNPFEKARLHRMYLAKQNPNFEIVNEPPKQLYYENTDSSDIDVVGQTTRDGANSDFV